MNTIEPNYPEGYKPDQPEAASSLMDSEPLVPEADTVDLNTVLEGLAALTSSKVVTIGQTGSGYSPREEA